MATVLEEPVAYKMPVPRVGQVVDWYPGGNKAKAMQATVREVYPEKIKLLAAMGAYPLHTCFHCDHPSVVEKQVRFEEDGTWDFTPEEKAGNAWKAQVESDLIALSKRLEALESVRPSNAKKSE